MMPANKTEASGDFLAPLPTLTSASLAIFLGIGHMVVDGVCNYTVASPFATEQVPLETAAWMVAVYNLLAFPTQPVLGWLVDRLGSPKTLAAIGCLLVAGACVSPADHVEVRVVYAGLGNAIYHVAAGSLALGISRGGAAVPGMFVGPGQFGVLWGTSLAYAGWIAPWPLALGAMACMLPVMLTPTVACWALPEGSPRRQFPLLIAVVALLGAAVMARGMMSGVLIRPFAMQTGMAAAICAAQFIASGGGGLLADRVGWFRVGLGAMVLGVPLLLLAPAHWMATLIAITLVQIPMGITLGGLGRLLPRSPGLAFGITAACVYGAGSLPKLTGGTWVPAGFQLLGAAVLATGLFLLGRAIRGR